MEIFESEQQNKISITHLERYFSKFKENTIGDTYFFESIYGKQKLLYADWIASGRLYHPIEAVIQDKIGPMLANTHSFSSQTGKASTYAYQYARELIKKHVNANDKDVLVATGAGMTAALSKLQRIMGLRSKDNVYAAKLLYDSERPVVFITHMEHHSNQVPWYETIADVIIVPSDENNLVCPIKLEEELSKYKDRSLKIGSFTACSNVTGIITPYYELAKVMHKHEGFCFVDFAASAPYVVMDMHPENPEEQLDAIFFSPHKFLGGPGTCGVLLFNEKLYNSSFPDNPGGGNVKWTAPDGTYQYSASIEIKEDGGTPGFLQVIRTALVLELKQNMGVDNIKLRELELLDICYKQLEPIPNLYILGSKNVEKIGCISFVVQGIHYNLIVRLLNDRFGIQVRGGWSCASTYAHSLLGITEEKSKEICKEIDKNEFSKKPGWVRLSLHPTLSNEELLFICNAIESVILNIEEWQESYQYNSSTNEFENSIAEETIDEDVKKWFVLV